MPDRESCLSPCLIVTALKDEAASICRGVRRTGKIFCRPTNGHTLVDFIDKTVSASPDSGENAPRKIDVAYVGPGESGIGLVSALLGKGNYRAVCFCGLAGGLAPGLRPGAIVSGTAVRSPGEVERPVSRILLPNQTVHPGVILSVDRLVAHPAEKMFFRSSEGADTVDMESYSWIRCAEKAHVPAYVFRVVSDGADDPLPPELLTFVTPSGETSPIGILKAILGRPSLLSDLLSMRRSIALARARLSDLGAILSLSVSSRGASPVKNP